MANWSASLVEVTIDSYKRPKAAGVVYSDGEQKFIEPISLLGVNRAGYKALVQSRIDQLNAASDLADALVLGPIDTTPDPPDPPTKEQQDRSAYFKAQTIAQRASALQELGVIDDPQIVADSLKAAHDLFKPEYLD